jgi:hypothetical protein
MAGLIEWAHQVPPGVIVYLLGSISDQENLFLSTQDAHCAI